MKIQTAKHLAVIREINNAIVKEELAVPLYTSHIEQTLFWSGLSKDKQVKMIQGLKILTRESKAHSLALKKIIEIYNQSK